MPQEYCQELLRDSNLNFMSNEDLTYAPEKSTNLINGKKNLKMLLKEKMFVKKDYKYGVR